MPASITGPPIPPSQVAVRIREAAGAEQVLWSGHNRHSEVSPLPFLQAPGAPSLLDTLSHKAGRELHVSPVPEEADVGQEKGHRTRS